MRRFAAIACLFVGCQSAVPQAAAPLPDQAAATHSWSKPADARIRNVGFDWNVDFERRSIAGTVVMRLERITAGAIVFPLDTRDLEIDSVEALAANRRERLTDLAGAPAATPLRWSLGPSHPILGSALEIALPADVDLLRIRYRTRPDASGLQWLPAVSANSYPFLYSQGQAIHARSYWPCQDTPAVRFTFDAVVRVPTPLVVVMAASNDSRAEERDGPQRVFRFHLPEPVPSYLVAIAVGDLAFRPLGPRTGVWANPALLERAAEELQDAETMLTTVEGLYGPYRWERYDMLVLPPAFPYGGMENPHVTFLTPTALTGDRSSASLMAHEMAHSWSGNLVTNATWADFWLNEGFTSYIEGRIIEVVDSAERRDIEARLGLESLRRSLATTPLEEQALHLVAIRGRDPDDASGSVAYEKGMLFLRRLEEAYGREVFDPFLRAWFDEHAFTSRTTDDFRAFLEARLVGAHSPLPGQSAPDLDLWIDGVGLPTDVPTPAAMALTRIDEISRAWLAGDIAAEALPTQTWTALEWAHFLRGLPKDVGASRLAALDRAQHLTTSQNGRVVSLWLALAIEQGYAGIDTRLEPFLTEVGRMWFIEPVYRALAKTPTNLERARAIYARVQRGYHPITRTAIERILASTADR